jgi:signal transduction histidine kinase
MDQQEAASIEDKQGLAHDLHSAVTECFYSISLHAEAAGMALAAGRHDMAAANLRNLRELALDALREMCLRVSEHPPVLELRSSVEGKQR